MKTLPDEYSDAEAAKRRDEVLKRMLNTKPEPRVTHAQSRVPPRTTVECIFL